MIHFKDRFSSIHDSSTMLRNSKLKQFEYINIVEKVEKHDSGVFVIYVYVVKPV